MKLITVFGSARLESTQAAYHEARAWGKAIAQAGFGVATGGYNGAMEAVSLGAKEAGGWVVGVTAPPLFPQREGPNTHVDLELPSPSLMSRIERLIDLGTACVALPGGVGTLTELTCAWNLNHIAAMQGKPLKPIGIHGTWLRVLRPGLEVTPEALQMLTPLGSIEELEVFINKLKTMPSFDLNQVEETRGVSQAAG